MPESLASDELTVAISDLAGPRQFAFKFNGYAVVWNVLWHLSGVGHFKIESSGRITGSQRSSTSPLQGQGAQILNAAYSLEGKIFFDSGELSAIINFTKTSGEGQDVQARFYVQVAGNTDHLWFITSGANLPPSDVPVAEFVTLEAVRMET